MGLKVGIVGLPNVGKSTLFNAILGRQQALTAPYPFATVEPNVGVVEVPDERLVKLRDAMFPDQSSHISENSENSDSQNVRKSENQNARNSGSPALRSSELSGTPSILSFLKQPPLVLATVTFVDIAGLVKGAAEGQGLGNQFLGHIRDVNLILHVLRDFDGGIARAPDSKNPEHDAEIVRTELELKDLEVAERKSERKSKGSDSFALAQKPVIYAINVDEKKLGEAPAVRSLSSEASGLAPESVATAGFGRSSDFSLREKSGSSEKPVIYAVNVGEDKLAALSEHSENSDSRISPENQRTGKSEFPAVRSSDSPTFRDSEYSEFSGRKKFIFCAKVEEEISKMPINEQKEYLKIYGLERSCLDRIIDECFRALGLISFFTAPASAEASAGQAGKWEIRAWPVRKDSPAPKAAGVIHSDFEKLFIRAKVIEWEKLAACGSWQAAKERGWVRTEGRDYLVKDGEVCNFLIGK